MGAVLRPRRQAEQERRHDPEIMDDCGPGRGHIGPPAPGVKAVGHDDAARRAQHRHAADGERVCMMERQRVQQALAAVFQRHKAAGLAIPAGSVEEIAVGEDATLGAPRGARGVEQRCLLVDAWRATAPRTATGRREPGREGGGIDNRHGVRQVAHRSLDIGQPLRHRDRQGRLRMVEEIDHLVPPVGRVDGHDAATERVQRPPVQVKVGPVLQQQRHAVAAAVACRAIEGAERRHPLPRFAVADFDPLGMVGPTGHRRGAEAAALRHPEGRRLEQLEHRLRHRRPVY